jgi:hypothetical protein
LIKDLKARVPLAVVWNNEEELKSFLPSITLEGGEHTEIKDIFTGLHIKPADQPTKVEGEMSRRFFYVFQIITHIDGIRKLFFPFQLAMDNCWFPTDLPVANIYNRFFFCNLKSPVLFDEKAEWSEDAIKHFKTIDEEDQDCYEDFIKGMKILENKEQVMEELHCNLKELEDKMTQHVFMGQGRELKDHDKGDNILTEEDKAFLEEKGFDPQELDNLFMEKMKSMGMEGELEEKKEGDDLPEIPLEGYQNWREICEREKMAQEDRDAVCGHDSEDDGKEESECILCSA